MRAGSIYRDVRPVPTLPDPIDLGIPCRKVSAGDAHDSVKCSKRTIRIFDHSNDKGFYGLMRLFSGHQDSECPDSDPDTRRKQRTIVYAPTRDGLLSIASAFSLSVAVLPIATVVQHMLGKSARQPKCDEMGCTRLVPMGQISARNYFL